MPCTDGASTSGLDPRAKALFEEAIEKPEAERVELLIRACADPALRAEVESLLLAHELCEQTFGKAAKEPLAEQPGQVIGNYKLLQEIGSGGFGVVWMAEQLEPVRRKVALKVLKLGMDTRQVVARFEAERQALAVMDHPNIAKVFDGGATDRGRPYFVMELVRGEPITRYCDEAGLSIGERLRLFLLVCQAVQHAHTKGIIHRDLKPGNVLVTLHDGTPVPKVIDFGVAKATHRELTTKTLFTEFRQLIGTPEYMAPEQAELSGLDVDTRADIYSLGVLLYELLTGSRPFELKDAVRAGGEELLRRIKEDEPPKPSTRASTPGLEHAEAARTRRIHPKALPKLLRHDLDWMVMKALEKERSRRYETASAFAEDVLRYLDDRPVLAGPPGRLYQVTKYLRRHRVGVTAVAAVFLSLVVGLGAALISYADARDNERLAIAAGKETEKQKAAAISAQQQEQRLRLLAEASERRAQKVTELVQNALIGADPNHGGAQKYLVTDAMDKAIAELDSGALKDDPETEASLQVTIAGILNGNGRSADARQLAQRALETRQRLFPGDHADVAESLYWLARCQHRLGQFAEARSRDEAALAMRQRLFQDDHLDVAASLGGVATCLRSLGHSDEALPKFKAALEMRRRLGQGDDPAVATAINNLGACQRSLGQDREALRNLDAALEMYRRLFKGDDPELARTLCNAAVCRQALGQNEDALAQFQEALEMRQRLFEGDHVDVARSLRCVGRCLVSLRRDREALPMCKAALEMYRRLFSGDHCEVANSLNSVAHCLGMGHPEASPLLQASLEMNQRLFPGDHEAVTLALNDLAACVHDSRGAAEALPRYQESLAMFRRLYPHDHPGLATSIYNIAGCLKALDRGAEALPLFQESLAMRERVFKGEHSDVAASLKNVAACLHSLGRSAEALPYAERANDMASRTLSAGHPWRKVIADSLQEIRSAVKR